MKENTKHKIKSAIVITLETIWKVAEDMTLLYLDRKEFYKRKYHGDYNYSKFSDQLRKMEKAKLIVINENKRGFSISITNKGKIKCIEQNNDLVTDGKWRMLSFDIPEDYRNKRNQFRRSIKKVGFKQVQKSLWACPYVKADEIDLIIQELNIRKYVVYLIVEKTDSDQYLNKLF